MFPHKFANVGRFFNGVTSDGDPRQRVANLQAQWVLVGDSNGVCCDVCCEQCVEMANVTLYLVLVACKKIPIKTEMFWDYGVKYSTSGWMTPK